MTHLLGRKIDKRLRKYTKHYSDNLSSGEKYTHIRANLQAIPKAAFPEKISIYNLVQIDCYVTGNYWRRNRLVFGKVIWDAFNEYKQESV